MISPEEIKEIRKLVDAATRGPWQSCNGDNFAGSCIEGIHYQNRVDVIVDDGLYDQHKVGVRKREDAAFIAVARTLVPRLLDEVERLQGLLGIDKWYMQKNFEASQGMLDVIKKERDQTNVKLAAAMNVVDAAKIMRIYCLGSDVSTKNMLAQFDAVLAALDRSKK